MKTKVSLSRSVQKMQAIKDAMRKAIEEQKKETKKPNT